MKKSNFERYIPGRVKGRETELSLLEVGKCYCFAGKTKKDILSKIYYHMRKHGKEFEYLECVNGIVVKRIK